MGFVFKFPVKILETITRAKKFSLNLLIFLHTIKIFNCLHEIMFLAHNTEKQHEKTKPY